jgi:hypothetical protein
MDQETFREKISRRVLYIRAKLLNREVAVFGFFLLLAFILWFLNTLDKDLTGRIIYSARYINLSENRSLVNELPDKLTLTVKGPGYSIIKNRLMSNKPPLPVDLSKVNYTVTRDDQRYEFYILTYGLRTDIARRLRDEFEIISINPDTIYFEFDRLVKKMVPVIPVVEVVPEKQFMLYGLITSVPDSIMISGARTIVDTINAVYTKPDRVLQAKSNISLNLSIEPIKKIEFSSKKVTVNIPVEQFTEAVKDVKVILLNPPDSGLVRLFPDKVKVYCNVAVKDYNALLASPIEAYSDMKGIDIRSTEKLNVSLRNIPLFASSVRHNPREVEYIFEKKQ